MQLDYLAPSQMLLNLPGRTTRSRGPQGLPRSLGYSDGKIHVAEELFGFKPMQEMRYASQKGL